MMESEQTLMIPIWSTDSGYTAATAGKIIAHHCGCSEAEAKELFQIATNAISRLQENNKTKILFQTDEQNPHPLNDIYFGYPDDRRMGQAFIDATTNKTRIFLQPLNLLTDFQKTDGLSLKDKEDVLCYLIAHELEHTCQGQKSPVLETINKQNYSDKANQSPKFEMHLLDTVIESDAAAIGLVAAQNCGLSEKALSHLQTSYFSWFPQMREILFSDMPDAIKEKNLTKSIENIRKTYWPNKEFNYPALLTKASKYPDVFSKSITASKAAEKDSSR